MDRLLQDLRFALRQLRRAPGFALTAVLVLALGIGANTAIFSLLDQALFRPLPVRDPKQLVIPRDTGTAWTGRTSSHGSDVHTLFSLPMVRDLKGKNTVFSGLLATSTTNAGIQWGTQSLVQDAELVSGNYFNLLGVQPALGRLLSDADDRVTAPPVIVLSNEFWHDRLGADRSIVGKTLAIDAQPVTVIGVAAPGFRSAVWGQTPAFFAPLSMTALLDPSQKDAASDRRDRWLNVVARLHDGITAPNAQAALAPLWHGLRQDELNALGHRSPKFVAGFLTNSHLDLLPGATGLSYSRDQIRKPLLVVMSMALLILLLASVNITGLLLVRAQQRAREFSVRYALGATGSRILKQLLLEGMLLGLAGAALGVALAPFAMRVLSARMTDPGDPPFFASSLNIRLLLLSFGIAFSVTLAASLVPALAQLKPDLVAALKSNASSATGHRLTFRRAIVVLQLGLSVVLLVGAGLLTRTLAKLRAVDPGFDTSHLVTFGIRPALSGYTTDQFPALHRDVIAALSSIRSVEAVGASDSPELAGSESGTNVTVEGYTPPPDEDLDIGRYNVSPGYFSTLREPVVAGRDFTEADDLAHPSVAIVNESFAQHYFGSAIGAIGKRMAIGGGKDLNWMSIVGVSRDAHHTGLREPVKMTDFTPVAQNARVSNLYVYMRTATPPSTFFHEVESTMHRVAPGIALDNLTTVDDQVERSLGNERLIGLLSSAFGILAALLAGVGLYGIVAYTTAQRTREIGIRMALGSSRAAVSGLVLRDVALLAGAAVAIALPCAAALARLLRSQLYGVSSSDPLTIVAVAAIMAAVALVAASIPARRAANVDPTEALRSE